MNQGCLRGFAFGITVLGVLLGLLGIVFLLAPGHATQGLIMLVISLGVVLFAASRIKALAAASPEGVEQQLTALAAGSNGEITVTAAAGHTGLDDAVVQAGFERLLRKGLVQIERRQGVEYYIFPGLREQKMVKKCPYCGNEYPVATTGRICPSCGGNLEIRPD